MAQRRKGVMRGRVLVANATVEDWEDVSSARCPSGDCLYIADIGDNERSRRQVRIYRVPEPEPDGQKVTGTEIFTARYPDGPHDAEALFTDDRNGLYIITKDDKGVLYRFPQPLRTDGDMPLQRVRELGLRRVTDADTSRDGKWVAVRTHSEVVLYPIGDLVGEGGAPRGTRVSVAAAREPQGEGVALDANATLFLVSEAGENGRAGRLTTLRCSLP